ncbi:MAG: hypothetical protein CFE26_06505 [Verrucomicrobiales bacterium VVV1]|nr:MAG: hypothetical protein CFE26_06505 [Verrucomicrobiales bacterium VVV1]
MIVSASQRNQAGFEKISECLHRYAATGGYYARVWISGKEIRRSLKTKDAQLAKRRLRELRADLERVDATMSETTVGR